MIKKDITIICPYCNEKFVLEDAKVEIGRCWAVMCRESHLETKPRGCGKTIQLCLPNPSTDGILINIK